jgi:SWI/SNF-related matrix-associated actin-dependent regulator 1 of chromatin subfamily A
MVKNGVLRAAVDAAWIFTGLPMTGAAENLPVNIDGARIESTSLYPFQKDGARFLAQRDYALLCDEMGLGKTGQALVAAEARLIAARGASLTTPHVLIICPALAKLHWRREVLKWTGYEAAVIEGLAAKDLPQARYIIANYDILYGQRRRDAAGKMHDVGHLGGWRKQLAGKFPIVVIDEAHNLRGRDSHRSKAVAEVCKGATCVWMLTGTPIPNHVRDLWALWDIMSGGLAGYFWPWAKAYCGAYKGAYGWVADGSSATQELSQRLSFFMLGRSKAVAGLELPEKRREMLPVDVGTLPVTGTPIVRESHSVGRTNAVAAALRATARAKQPAIVENTNAALAAGQKVVVFVYLRQQVEEIAKALKPGLIIATHGGDSVESRDAAAKTFREYIGPAAFVATIDAVGIAISLVGADLVIFGDLSWEPAKLLQAEGRAHRHGSTARVLVRYIIAAGTIDDAVADAVIAKLATIEAAIGTTPDADELSRQLGRDGSTSEQILARLFDKLTAGG